MKTVMQTHRCCRLASISVVHEIDKNTSNVAPSHLDANLTGLHQGSDIAAAVDALEGAVYIYPYDIELYQDLAGYQTSLGNWERFAQARRALLALDPVDRAEAYYQLAFAYERAGNRSSAREQILYALEIAPNFQRAQELLLSLRAATPAAAEAQ